MINDILKYTFLQNSMLAALFASVACGIIGVIIIEKKLVMMSGGISHASFGGIGLGYLLGVEPLATGLIFSVATSLLIVEIKKRGKAAADTLIGMFWSVGMALGIIFIAIKPGYPPDMTSYLFGDILTVGKMDLALTVVLDILVVFSIVLFFQYWKAYLFDEEFLQVLSVNIDFFEKYIFILIAISVIVLIKVVGIILLISMLTVPPSIGKMYTNNLAKLFILSIFISLGLFIGGIVFSYYLNIPSGASIIIISALSYIANLKLKGQKNF